MYRELVEAGKLQSSLEDAAEQTALELDQLIEVHIPAHREHQFWFKVKPESVFTFAGIHSPHRTDRLLIFAHSMLFMFVAQCH